MPVAMISSCMHNLEGVQISKEKYELHVYICDNPQFSTFFALYRCVCELYAHGNGFLLLVGEHTNHDREDSIDKEIC